MPHIAHQSKLRTGTSFQEADLAVGGKPPEEAAAPPEEAAVAGGKPPEEAAASPEEAAVAGGKPPEEEAAEELACHNHVRTCCAAV